MLRSSGDWFCCLGVLCDISGYGKWGKSDGIKYYYEQEGQSEESEGIILPIFVAHFANIEGEDQDVLTGMNDDDKLSFNKIADWIEANIKEDQ